MMIGSHDHHYNSLRSLSSSSRSELRDLCAQVPLIIGLESSKRDTISFDYDSKDTLQSLVQSCMCGRDLTRQQMSITSHVLPKPNAISEKKHEAIRVDGTSLLISYSSNVASEKVVMAKKQKNKKRIKWTEDLDKKFINSVNCLGGSKKATPSGILRLMNCEGLTLFHVKSHLQKYRVTRRRHEVDEGNDARLDLKTRADIVEAVRLQMDVQRRLHEQLENQKNLQMKIEEQAKQLHDMLQRQLKRN